MLPSSKDHSAKSPSNASETSDETTPRRSQRLQSRKPARTSQSTQTPWRRCVSVSTQTSQVTASLPLWETQHRRHEQKSASSSRPHCCGSSRHHSTVSPSAGSGSLPSRRHAHLDIEEKLLRENSDSSGNTHYSRNVTVKRRRTASWGSSLEFRRSPQTRRALNCDEFHRVGEGSTLIASSRSPRGKLMLESALRSSPATSTFCERTAFPSGATATSGSETGQRDIVNPGGSSKNGKYDESSHVSISGVARNSRSAQMLEAALKTNPPGILISGSSSPRKVPSGVVKRVTFK